MPAMAAANPGQAALQVAAVEDDSRKGFKLTESKKEPIQPMEHLRHRRKSCQIYCA